MDGVFTTNLWGKYPSDRATLRSSFAGHEKPAKGAVGVVAQVLIEARIEGCDRSLASRRCEFCLEDRVNQFSSCHRPLRLL
jgi:hypothetical protein